MDSDGDGLIDSQEEKLGTNPQKPDSDGDGLKDGVEVDMGTDPLVEDSDGDTLLDGFEVRQGTDPNNVDTDGDTYQDNWELDEGTDPVDPESRIYQGYWPYNPDKDLLGNLHYFDAERVLGALAPRFTLVDQYGDVVDFYDFYNDEGAYIVLDLSAMWCPPCQGLADWLAGNDPLGDKYYPNIRNNVNSRKLYWITVLGEDLDGAAPSVEDLQTWEDEFPNDNIPVLAGEDNGEFIWFFINGGWPSLYLFAPDLTLYTDSYVLDAANSL